MKFKDIIVILLGLMLCIFLGYLAFTARHWWEWLFIVLIVVCIGLQAKDYIVHR